MTPFKVSTTSPFTPRDGETCFSSSFLGIITDGPFKGFNLFRSSVPHRVFVVAFGASVPMKESMFELAG